jgi:hypothetical protein
MTKQSADLSKKLRGYSSEWVALEPKTSKVVAAGKTPKNVIEKARKKGVESPVLTKVPKDYGTYIL